MRGQGYRRRAWTRAVLSRLTHQAGPFFVLIAATLLPICFVTFFEVVFPHRFLQPDTWFLTTLFGLLWCLYIVYSITFHCALLCRPTH